MAAEEKSSLFDDESEMQMIDTNKRVKAGFEDKDKARTEDINMANYQLKYFFHEKNMHYFLDV